MHRLHCCSPDVITRRPASGWCCTVGVAQRADHGAAACMQPHAWTLYPMRRPVCDSLFGNVCSQLLSVSVTAGYSTVCCAV